MSIDPAIEDLILKEIDGVATPEESARLRALAEGDTAVREELAAHRELTELLGRVAPLEAPIGLSQEVMDSLPAGSPARFPAPRPPAGGPGGRTLLGYFYAAAAGLLIGALLSPFVMRRLGSTDPSHAVGAIGNPRSITEETLSTVTIEEGDLSGTARLRSQDGGLAVEIAITTPANVQIRLSFDESRLQFSGFEQVSGRALNDLDVTPGDARWSASEGVNHWTIDLLRLDAAPSEIRMAFELGEDAQPILRTLTVPPG